MRCKELDSREDLTDFLAGMLRFSEQDAECCEGPITWEDVKEAAADYGAGEAPRLDGLPYEIYISMPDFFGHLLMEVYANWQQNECIPRSVHQGVVTLVKKDSSKEDNVDNFRNLTLLSAELKILVKVLAKRLALVADGVIGDAIPGGTIQDNLHLLRYTIEGFGNYSIKG